MNAASSPRVVSLIASATEILHALGAGKRRSRARTNAIGRPRF